MLGVLEHPGRKVTVLEDRDGRLDGFQLRIEGRQPKQREVGRNFEFLRPAAAYPVKDNDGTLAFGKLPAGIPGLDLLPFLLGVTCASTAGDMARTGEDVRLLEPCAGPTSPGVWTEPPGFRSTMACPS